jgi:hypothetical protein
MFKARLRWEAASERLRNTLRPPVGAPVATPAEQIDALGIAREALDGLEAAILSGSKFRDGS